MKSRTRKTVYFDSTVRTKSGKRAPFWDSTVIEDDLEDKQEIWFHESYGRCKLYRLHKVDETNYIAEDLHTSKRK